MSMNDCSKELENLKYIEKYVVYLLNRRWNYSL